MFKKSIPYILLVLLIVAIVIGVMILVQLKAEPADEVDTGSIIGTYANGDPSMPNLTYLVMDRDGSYLIYKQLADEAIDRGSYRDVSTDGRYIMESSMTDEYEAVLDDGCIYLAGEGRTILRLEKFNDVPEYINFSK